MTFHTTNWQNQKVEEGQVICYIEQLGGELPIEVCVLTWNVPLLFPNSHDYELISVCNLTFAITNVFFIFLYSLTYRGRSSRYYERMAVSYLNLPLCCLKNTLVWMLCITYMIYRYIWSLCFVFCFFFVFGTDPVGYGDALIAVLPSFPGIKLQ